jgi:hypothetical protein
MNSTHRSSRKDRAVKIMILTALVLAAVCAAAQSACARHWPAQYEEERMQAFRAVKTVSVIVSQKCHGDSGVARCEFPWDPVGLVRQLFEERGMRVVSADSVKPSRLATLKMQATQIKVLSADSGKRSHGATLKIQAIVKTKTEVPQMVTDYLGRVLRDRSRVRAGFLISESVSLEVSGKVLFKHRSEYHSPASVYDFTARDVTRATTERDRLESRVAGGLDYLLSYNMMGLLHQTYGLSAVVNYLMAKDEELGIDTVETGYPRGIQDGVRDYLLDCVKERHRMRGIGLSVDALDLLLESEDWRRRKIAAALLGVTGNIEAVWPLIELLDTEYTNEPGEEEVREAAREALKDITGKKPGEDLDEWLTWFYEKSIYGEQVCAYMALEKEAEEPADSIPEFPWPPPEPSAQSQITREYLADSSADTTYLRDVDAKLRAAFDACGYSEKSYYSVPAGFALATRLEQINKDGTPKQPPERWAAEVQPLRKFSLKEYLTALFFGNPGYYRVIVFIVSSQPFVGADVEVTRDEAVSWLSGGMNVLPKSIGEREFSGDHYCEALIYEFEQPDIGDSAVIRMSPNCIDWYTHMSGTRLLEELTK